MTTNHAGLTETMARTAHISADGRGAVVRVPAGAGPADVHAALVKRTGHDGWQTVKVDGDYVYLSR